MKKISLPKSERLSPLAKLILAFVVFAIIILMVVLGQNLYKNGQLTPIEREAQNQLRHDIGKQDVDLRSIEIEDDDWKLVDIVSTSRDDKGNSAYVIMKGDQVAIGPGTSFAIEDLVSAGVPDKIITNFYTKPWWLNFNDYQTEYFAKQTGMVKDNILAFAASKQLTVDKVTLIEKSLYGYHEPSTQRDYREFTGFRFTINNDAAEYTLKTTLHMETGQFNVTILDQSGQQVYSKDSVYTINA